MQTYTKLGRYDTEIKGYLWQWSCDKYSNIECK